MKKSILITCIALTAITLSSFAYMNWNNSKKCETASCEQVVASCNTNAEVIPRWENINVRSNMNLHYQLNKTNFVYNIDSRFIWNITKEKLKKATSILDIYPKEATVGKDNFSDVEFTIMKDGKEISAFSEGILLNKEQLELIQTLDYTSNFYVKANYGTFNYITGQSENHIIYYISVIPEQEAVYAKGQDALIDYLRINSAKEVSVVKEDKLQPGQISFTITTEGEVTDVSLNSTSGYDKLDEKMMKLIENMPEKWEAATNEKGEKVEQTLIFFYGIEGC